MIPTAQALAAIAAILDSAGIPDPRREARLILAYALGCDQATLFTHETVPDSTGITQAHRRASHEPLAYITGRREFWSLDLEVSPATLIPRPDSETLIDAALHHIPDHTKIHRILDLGTGTGALLFAALTEFPAATGIGTDRSPAATNLARRNAGHLDLHHRSAFICADWTACLTTRFDLILSNPPYITGPEIAHLMPEVARYEPASALDGGPDGLAAYRTIIADLPRLLTSDGTAILEAGIGQSPAIIALATAANLQTTTHPDLAGTPRAIVITSANQPRKNHLENPRNRTI